MFGPLLGRAWGWLAGMAAVIVAALSLYAKGRADANAKSEARATQEALKRRKVRDEVERETARSDAAERLRQRWSRD